VTTSGATFNGSTNPNGGDVLGEDFCYVAGLKLTDCIGSTEVPISPSTLPAAVLAFAVSTAVSGLDQARSYCYQLSATNAVGTSFSTPVCFAVAGSATVTTTTLPNHAPGKVAYTAHFNEDKSTLTTQDVVLCKTVATYMSLHRVRLVSMVGYADPLYTKAYNLVLGQRRALSVEHWILNDLRLMHTPLSATSARSLGATHFVEAGLSNRARALDRRVTIVLS
jgi:hypothetical protein